MERSTLEIDDNFIFSLVYNIRALRNFKPMNLYSEVESLFPENVYDIRQEIASTKPLKRDLNSKELLE